MPFYRNSPFQKVRSLQDGVPEYLFGSWNADVALARLLVSQVALTSNVATLTVQVVEGPIPAVGSLITVTGTQTSSGAFNVTRVALTGVTINAATGAGTVTFALTHTNVTATADAGVALVDTPEVPDTMANGSSVACTPLFQQVIPVGYRTLSVSVTTPTTPTAATVQLQGANLDQDAEYTNLGTILTIASSTPSRGSATVSGTAFRFYRLNISNLSGSGTIVGRVVCE